MSRNPSIELYRCMLMLGICCLHAITIGGIPCSFLRDVLLSCVVGFVFISGWFGVKFSWRKLVKLYGVGVYAALVLFVGLCLRDGGGYALNAAKAYNQLVHGFWFLHAYAFMTMLAPLVNAVVEKGGNAARMAVVPLIAMVWCWGFGLTLPIIGDKLPRTAGLDACGGITLLAIYAAARLCRICEVEKHLKTKWLVAALPVLLGLTGIGFGDYNSPFAFALAGVCFLLFAQLQIGRRIGRAVIWLTPSMFSVYLLHANAGFISAVKKLNCVECCAGGFMNIWLIGVAVFIISMTFDLPRRCFLVAFKRIVEGGLWNQRS